jgi:hypothetical protein
LNIAMTCKKLPDCGFIEKFSSTMPHTTNMVKAKYCAGKERCVINEVTKIMIEHDEDESCLKEKQP